MTTSHMLDLIMGFDQPAQPEEKRDVEITRMDFQVTAAGVMVRKFARGWVASTPPFSSEMKPKSFDLDAALAWCVAHGWIVRRWSGGARAWRDQLMPIRNAEEIRRMRRRVTMQLYTTQGRAGTYQLDLAYDL